MNPDNPMPKATHENPKLPSARPAGSGVVATILGKVLDSIACALVFSVGGFIYGLIFPWNGDDQA